MLCSHLLAAVRVTKSGLSGSRDPGETSGLGGNVVGSSGTRVPTFMYSDFTVSSYTLGFTMQHVSLSSTLRLLRDS